jgi:hypothetical protein
MSNSQFNIIEHNLAVAKFLAVTPATKLRPQKNPKVLSARAPSKSRSNFKLYR